jgi:hypothetical protein
MNKQAIINDFVRAAFEAGGVENLNIKQVVLNLSYRYNEGVKTVNAIVQEAIKARRNNPGLKYSLDENGFILMERGGKFVQIESCRDLSGGKSRHHQPWKRIEQQCLLFSLRNHRDDSNIHEVCGDLAPYFDRNPLALVSEYYRLLKK